MSTPSYFDLDGSPCSERRAVELLADLAARTVARTNLEIAGQPVMVSTVFTIVDQVRMLYNIDHPDGPVLWVTEVIGGPPDMDGTFEYAASVEGAREVHDRMVERVIASGCELVDKY